MKKLLIKYYLQIVISIVVIIALVLLINDDDGSTLTFNPTPSMPIVDEVAYIYVDLKGEVMNPGVYKVKETTRLFQLIILAGGVTNDADKMAFNSSVKLSDEQVIYIPSIDDQLPSVIDPTEDDNNNTLININTANVDQLDSLPGIGPSTAQNIINYRDENGAFLTVDDLINVPGIGEATMNEIKDFITT